MIFIYSLITGTFLMLVQAVLSYLDGFLTKNQVEAHHHYTIPSLPFVAHGQMWTDLLLVTPIISYLVADYSNQWPSLFIFIALVLGFFVSIILHRVYSKESKEKPGCHARDGKLTLAGYAHLVYMALVISILLLFFSVSEVKLNTLFLVAVVMIAHAMFGILQIPLYLGRKIWTTTNVVSILFIAFGVGLLVMWNLIQM